MSFLSTAAFSVTLDAASVARMAALINCAPIFTAYYSAAMNACVNRVATKAKQNTADRFADPTGTLMRGINGYVISPFEGVVGVGQQVPYARRREFGFNGMTDALGRTYTNDPGFFYLRDALEDSRPFIASAFRGAAQLAIRDIILR